MKLEPYETQPRPRPGSHRVRARASAPRPMNSRETAWQWVESRQVCRQKFRREYPLPPYTADFCCVELKLILEVDGADHFTEAGQERDRVRDEALAKQGYLVVRISGFDVLREPERVCQGIEERVRERIRELGVDRGSTPHPRPLSPRRGEGRLEIFSQKAKAKH